MPPSLALLVWSVLVFVFLRWSEDSKHSPALWLPVVWLLIMGSKLPSQWLGLSPMSVTTAFEEGSGLDRIIYLALIVLALWVLTKRQINWSELFAHNHTLAFLLVFALASTTWSDYPFVSFKRWVRDLGMYMMVLVVLSNPHPLMSISTVIRRFSTTLLMLSLMLIKYYPQIGVSYNPFDGTPEYVGATTSKNMLGVLCLIGGLFYFWDTLGRWPERKTREAKRSLFVDTILMAITLRLLRLSDSATSLGCLIIGCVTVMIVGSKWAKTNAGIITASIPIVVAVYFALEIFSDPSTIVASLLGRDPTLTGRTGIWATVLELQPNPLLGVGYQSFWMGDRLKAVWSRLDTGFLNEAHNGYLETYLNLGFFGVALLVVLMASSYRTISRQITSHQHFASFAVALWVVMVFYNFTEAAFLSSAIWLVFLLCVVIVPHSDQLPL